MLPKWKWFWLVEHKHACKDDDRTWSPLFSTSIMGGAEEAHYARARSSSFVFPAEWLVKWDRGQRCSNQIGRACMWTTGPNAHARSGPIRYGFPSFVLLSLPKSWLVTNIWCLLGPISASIELGPYLDHLKNQNFSRFFVISNLATYACMEH